jgi:hypothetical protein
MGRTEQYEQLEIEYALQHERQIEPSKFDVVVREAFTGFDSEGNYIEVTHE